MLNVKLHHLSFLTENQNSMVDFYQNMMGMSKISHPNDDVILQAKNRIIHFAKGAKNTLNYAGYITPDIESLEKLRLRHLKAGLDLFKSPSPIFGDSAYAIKDPDGNRLVFGHSVEKTKGESSMAGRMQHVVVASTNVEPLINFYADQVGFVISDIVKKEDGQITSCFMRSDNEHHSFAVFLGESNKLDHNCYETDSWNDIRDWADHFAEAEIPIFWGPGRHGPGNNLFIMVKDPDGNPVELSAEIEEVEKDRQTGFWIHNERTLNSWGKGLLRVD